MSGFLDTLRMAFGAARVRTNVPLAPYTTFRVGGPADWFLETSATGEIVRAFQLARAAKVAVTLLGGGSNVLVADRGIRGLVIHPRGGEIVRVDDQQIRADAAVSVNGLVRWCVLRGVAGLEAWAGTPGTVGGAVYGNAHFGGQLIGETISAVQTVAPSGVVSDLSAADMEFGYDCSRLRRTGEILLSATFVVTSGEPGELRATARASLAYRKRTQPLDVPSAGCVFQNPQAGRDRMPDGLPWSAGALIDRAGLKGARIGGARVSTTHGNFIVTDRTATARDIRRLIAQCHSEVQRRFGVELREEIVYLGDFNVHVTD